MFFFIRDAMVMVSLDSKKTLTMTNPYSLYLNGDDSGMYIVGGCIQHTQIILILLCSCFCLDFCVFEKLSHMVQADLELPIL